VGRLVELLGYVDPAPHDDRRVAPGPAEGGGRVDLASFVPGEPPRQVAEEGLTGLVVLLADRWGVERDGLVGAGGESERGQQCRRAEADAPDPDGSEAP